MNKELAGMSVLATLLVLNTSSIVFAAPSSTNTVITGRTQQNNQTGVITPTAVQTQIYHNVTNNITLNGTIVIDGPKLVLTVLDPNGNTVSADKITVVKVNDTTYTYSINVDPSAFKGNVSYTLNAKTVYINGKTAGQTHTSAPESKQIIHVAYVSSFEYSNLEWGAYDRAQNQYPFSYKLIKVWDDGTKVPENITGIVSGTGSVLIQGSDITFDGGVITLATEIPPVNILSFETQNPIWSYNEAANKYDLTFTLIKNLSNGNNEQVTVSIQGIEPSATYTYTANDSMSPDFSYELLFAVPVAPEATEAVVSNVTVSIISSLWTGNNGGNVQEKYTLNYSINGQQQNPVELSTNFTKNGTGLFGSQNLIYEAQFNGQTVSINYTLNYVEPNGTTSNP